MKLSAQTKVIALLFSVGLFAGCSTTGESMDDGGYDSDVAPIDQDQGSTVYGGSDQGGISSSSMTEEERMEIQQQAELEALREITTFYFDFDTSEIKPEARDVLMAHARYLSSNPSQNVRLEGHGDERGSKEYNLAIGERRANAVQRFLVVNGASRGQMETVSYGEEKPAVMGSSESAWAQNRRVELVFE